MSKHTRIGLFGGSFDPPTKAHLHTAEKLIDDGVVDVVEFVPAYVSYHGKEYGATGRDRVQMLENLITESDHRWNISVNRYEIQEKMNSSTCDFVEKFLKMVNMENGDYHYCRYNSEPGDTFEYFFIVGADNAKKIPNFRNSKKLMSLINFIIVNRGNIDLSDIAWCQDERQTIVDIGDKYTSCSSSKIRESIETMEKIGLESTFFEWCSLEVFAYILSHELYGLED